MRNLNAVRLISIVIVLMLALPAASVFAGTYQSDVQNTLEIPSSGMYKQPESMKNIVSDAQTGDLLMRDISTPVPSAVRDDWSFLDAHNVGSVHSMGISGSGVTVGVVDTGVDFGNQNLDGKYKTFDVSTVPSDILANNSALNYYDGWPMAFDPYSMRYFLATGNPAGTYYLDTSKSGSGPFEVSHTIKVDGQNDFGPTESIPTDDVSVYCPDTVNHYEFDLKDLYASRDDDNWYFGFTTIAGGIDRDFTLYFDLDGPTSGSLTDPTGKYTGFESSHANMIQRVKVSHDGTYVASSAIPGLTRAEDKNMLRIWFPDGSFKDLEHNSNVIGFAWYPDDSTIISTTKDDFYLWNTATWSLEDVIPHSPLVDDDKYIDYLSINADGTMLATVTGQLVSIYMMSNLSAGPVMNINAAGGCRDLVFSPTDPNLIAYTSATNIYIHNISGGALDRILLLGGHSSDVSSIAWEDSGNQIISGDINGYVAVWSVSDLSTNWTDHDFATYGLYSARPHDSIGMIRHIVGWSGTTVFSAASDSRLVVFDTSSGSETVNVSMPNDSPVRYATFRNGNIITGTEDGVIREWTSSSTYNIFYSHRIDAVIDMHYTNENADMFADSVSPPTVYKWDGTAWKEYSIFDCGTYTYASVVKTVVVKGFVEIAISRDFFGGEDVNGIRAELVISGEDRPQDSVPRDRNFDGRSNTDFTFTDDLQLSNFGLITIKEYSINTADIPSASGVYHFGNHMSEIVKKTFGTLGVLVVDSSTPGVYDEVYLDMNQDYVFDANDVKVDKSNPTAAIDVTGDGIPDISAGTLYFIASSEEARDEVLSVEGTEAYLAHIPVGFPSTVVIKKNGVEWSSETGSEDFQDIEGTGLELQHGNIASLKITGSHVPVSNETIFKSTGGYDTDPIYLAHHDTITDDFTIEDWKLYGLIYHEEGGTPEFRELLDTEYTMDATQGIVTLSHDFIDSFVKGTEIYATYNFTGTLYDGVDYTLSGNKISLMNQMNPTTTLHAEYTYLPWTIDYSTGHVTFTDEVPDTDTITADYQYDGIPIPYSDIYSERNGIANVIPGNGALVCFFGDFLFDYGNGLAITHGTEVASAIASTEYGVAPDATILPVMNGDFSRVDSWYFTVEGYDGAPGTGDDADVVCSAIPAPSYRTGLDSLSQTLDHIIYDYSGVPFVVSAGDDGYGYGTVSVPSSTGAIVIGAATDNAYLIETSHIHHYGDIAAYSGRGPGLTGTAKPDFVAVGTGTVDTLLNGDGSTARATVESSDLSTAIAAGIAALSIQASLDAGNGVPSAETLKDIMSAGAVSHNYDPFVQGSGFIDAYKTIQIAAGTSGFYTSPSSWAAGTYGDEDYLSFPALAYPGENITQTFSVNSYVTGTVSLRSYTINSIGTYTYDFTTTGDSDGDITDITQHIPPATTLMRVTASTDAGVMPVSASYVLKVMDWVDANVDGVVDDDEVNTVTYDMFSDGSRNTLEIEIYNPLQRMHDAVLVAVLPGDTNGATGTLPWTVTCEFYENQDWDWISVPGTISVSSGSSTDFDAIASVPDDASPGMYEGYIEEKYGSTTVSGELTMTSPLHPATESHYLDASEKTVNDENVTMIDSTHGTLAHGNLTTYSLRKIASYSYNNESLVFRANISTVGGTGGDGVTYYGFYLPHGNITNETYLLIHDYDPTAGVSYGWFALRYGLDYTVDSYTGYVNSSFYLYDSTEVIDYYAYFTYEEITELTEGTDYTIDTYTGDVTLNVGLASNEVLYADYGWYTPVGTLNYDLTTHPLYNVSAYLGDGSNITTLIEGTDYTVDYENGNMTVYGPSGPGTWTLTIDYQWYAVLDGVYPRAKLSHTPIIPGSITLYYRDGSIVPSSEYSIEYESGAITFTSGNFIPCTADYRYYSIVNSIPVSIIVANKGLNMKIEGSSGDNIYSNMEMSGGYERGKTGDWRYFYVDVPALGTNANPPANLKYLIEVDWRSTAPVYGSLGAPDNIGTSISSGDSLTVPGFSPSFDGEINSVVAYVKYRSDSPIPESARPDMIGVKYVIGTAEGDTTYQAVPTENYTTAELDLTGDRAWTMDDIANMRFIVSMEEVGAPDTWNLEIDSVWLEVTYYHMNTDFDIRVFGKGASPVSPTLAPYSITELGNTGDPTEYEKILTVDITPGLNIIAVRNTAMNGTTSSEMFSLRTGTMEIPESPINVYTNQRIGSTDVSFTSNIDLPGMGGSVVGPASVTTYPNEVVHYDADAVENLAPVDFTLALAAAEYTRAIEVKNAASVYFHIIPHDDVEDLDLGIFYDFNGDGVAQRDELVTVALVPHIATDGWGGYDPYIEAVCADADADEGVTLYAPPDGTYLVKILGFTIPSGTGHVDLEVSMILAGVKGYEISAMHEGPVKAYEPATMSVSWSFADDAVDKGYSGVVYFGTNTAPEEIMLPFNVILDTHTPEVSKLTIGPADVTCDDLNPTVGPRPNIVAFYGDSLSGISAVSLEVDGKDVTKFSTLMDTQVSYTPMTDLSEGAHIVRITVEDAAGNRLVVSRSFQVVSEFMQEMSEGVEYLGTTDSSASPPGLVIESEDMTNSATYVLEGSTVPGSMVNVGGYKVLADRFGKFSIPLTLVEGDNTLAITITDGDGVEFYYSFTVVLDTTAPDLTFNIRPTVTTPSLEITGKVTDENGVRLVVNNEVVDVYADGGFRTTVSLVEGANTITFVATDAAGNSRTITRTVTLDSTAPEISVSAPALVTGADNNVTITITSPDAVSVMVNGVPATKNGDGTWTYSTTLLPGGNTFYIVAQDRYGNTGQSTVDISYNAPVNTVVTQTGYSKTTTYAAGAGALILGLIIGLIIAMMLWKKGPVTEEEEPFEEESEEEEPEEDMEEDEFEDIEEPVADTGEEEDLDFEVEDEEEIPDLEDEVEETGEDLDAAPPEDEPVDSPETEEEDELLDLDDILDEEE